MICSNEVHFNYQAFKITDEDFDRIPGLYYTFHREFMTIDEISEISNHKIALYKASQQVDEFNNFTILGDANLSKEILPAVLGKFYKKKCDLLFFK